MFHTIAFAAVLAGLGGVLSSGDNKPVGNGGCCIMRSSSISTCCNMCPECCEQKSCAKTCCNIAACNMRPACCK